MKKRVTFLLLLFIVIARNIFAGTPAWTDDFEAAKAEAKNSGKYLFINFSGSDWCVWCIKLSDEVFTKPEFLDYAKENLVLVTADFPRSKKQSDALIAQNKMLAATYRIEGFPTVIILNPQGEFVFKTGYQYGGAAEYVKHVKGIIKQFESKS